MAHERVPRCLYKHPVVEYIPLSPTTIKTGSLPDGFLDEYRGAYPALTVLNTADSWREAIKSFPFAFPVDGNLPPPETPIELRHDLTFLAVGCRVVAGIYRDRKASLVADELGPVYQLSAVPQRYFYKVRVDFTVFDHRGRQLAIARSIELPPKRVSR